MVVLSHLGTQEPGNCDSGDPGRQNLRAPSWSRHEQFLSPQGRGSRAAVESDSWTITNGWQGPGLCDPQGLQSVSPWRRS